MCRGGDDLPFLVPSLHGFLYPLYILTAAAVFSVKVDLFGLYWFGVCLWSLVCEVDFRIHVLCESMLFIVALELLFGFVLFLLSLRTFARGGVPGGYRDASTWCVGAAG